MEEDYLMTGEGLLTSEQSVLDTRNENEEREDRERMKPFLMFLSMNLSQLKAFL